MAIGERSPPALIRPPRPRVKWRSGFPIPASFAVQASGIAAGRILCAMDLDGASALVTGAGRGIGRAIALSLAGAGVRVTLTSRTAAELQALAQEIKRGGGQAIPVPPDLFQ